MAGWKVLKNERTGQLYGMREQYDPLQVLATITLTAHQFGDKARQAGVDRGICDSVFETVYLNCLVIAEKTLGKTVEQFKDAVDAACKEYEQLEQLAAGGGKPQ